MSARWFIRIPLLLVFILCLAWIAGELGLPFPFDRTGKFRAAIADADEIRIRRGGHDCCGSVDDQVVLCRITDPAVIRKVRENLKFSMLPSSPCQCCGYPGIDWYRDGKRIALTSVQHGKRLRWMGWNSDTAFTRHTREWLKAWFQRLDINYPEIYPEMDESKRHNLAEYIEPLIDEPVAMLYGLEVTDYSALARLERVERLYLNESSITDLTPLSGLATLRELNLYGTPVSDLTPLEDLPELRSLDLQFTKVKDLGQLPKLTGLERLEFSYLLGMDLSPLHELKNLKWLEVWYAEEKGADVEKLRSELQEKLPKCKINFFW